MTNDHATTNLFLNWEIQPKKCLFVCMCIRKHENLALTLALTSTRDCYVAARFADLWTQLCELLQSSWIYRRSNSRYAMSGCIFVHDRAIAALTVLLQAWILVFTKQRFWSYFVCYLFPRCVPQLLTRFVCVCADAFRRCTSRRF